MYMLCIFVYKQRVWYIRGKITKYIKKYHPNFRIKGGDEQLEIKEEGRVKEKQANLYKKILNY